MFTSFSRPAFLGAPAAAVAAVMLVAATPAVAQSQAVTGRNVTEVMTPESTFVLLPGNVWEERSRSGRFQFVEQNRDDWSVYLFDASRGVQIQLALDSRHVFYADANEPRPRSLYRISNTSAVVNGRNINRAWTANGEFFMTSPGRWEEHGSDGSTFRFTETNRDDRSVYLLDSSRGVRIQLDLHTRKVMYSDGSARMSPLYDISDVSAVD